MQIISANPVAMGAMQAIGQEQPMQSGGDFMAILGQLLGTNTETAAFEQTGEPLGEWLNPEDDMTATQRAMEMMAAMFMGVPTELTENPAENLMQNLMQNPVQYQVQNLTQNMIQNPMQYKETIQQGEAAEQQMPATVLTDSMASVPTDQTAKTTDFAQFAMSQTAHADPTPKAEKTAEPMDTVMQAATPIPKAAKPQEQSFTGEWTGEQNEEEVQTLFKLMSETGGRQRIRQVDNSEMLAQMQQGTGTASLHTTPELSQLEKPFVSPQALLAQVENGIREKLSSGSKEFVVKLNPEGMGEITVKLQEQADGKISLNIATSSQQTHNMLSGEISALREALRPMNAELTEMVNQQPTQQSFEQSARQQSQQHHRQQQQTDFGWNEDDSGDSTASRQQYSAALSSALNALA